VVFLSLRDLRRRKRADLDRDYAISSERDALERARRVARAAQSQRDHNLRIDRQLVGIELLEARLPGEARGCVDVHVSRENRHVLVSVADNGAGLPAGFDLSGKKGRGLKVVHTLATRLPREIRIFQRKAQPIKQKEGPR
jgi:hypothetical protein